MPTEEYDIDSLHGQSLPGFDPDDGRDDRIRRIGYLGWAISGDDPEQAKEDVKPDTAILRARANGKRGSLDRFVLRASAVTTVFNAMSAAWWLVEWFCGRYGAAGTFAAWLIATCLSGLIYVFMRFIKGRIAWEALFKQKAFRAILAGLLVAIVLIATIFSYSSFTHSKEVAASFEELREERKILDLPIDYPYQAGSYVVGKDIPEGEYELGGWSSDKGSKDHGYCMIEHASSESLHRENYAFKGKVRRYFKSGLTVTVGESTAIKPLVTRDDAGESPLVRHYFVGEDLAPGSYSVSLLSNETERVGELRVFYRTGEFADKANITNDDSTERITVSEGQVVVAENCKIVRVG